MASDRVMAINVLKVLKAVHEELDNRGEVETLDMAIKALEALDAAGDTISRQAAIRWVKTECNPYGKPTLDFESGKKVIEHLKQMPSAQPETHEERTETHACDLISRQEAVECNGFREVERDDERRSN